MAGLDPIPFNSPRKEPGEKREEVVKSSLINVEVTQRLGKKRGPCRGPVHDTEPWVE